MQHHTIAQLESLVLNKQGKRSLKQQYSTFWTFWSLEQARTRKGRLRYHMGQVAMIRFMNSLVACGHKALTILCDPDHLTMKADTQGLWRDNVHASERFIQLNLDPAIKHLRMSEVIRSHIERADPEFVALRATVMKVLFSFRDEMLFDSLSEPALRALQQYRFYPPPATPPSLARVAQALHKRFAVPEDLLLTTAYLFFSRPSWFSAFWQADFTACLALEARKGLVLLEAHRNAYAWRSMECIFRIANSEPDINTLHLEWPATAFLQSLPAADGDGFMKLDIPTGCIFLDATQTALEQQLAKVPAPTRQEFAKILSFPDDLCATTQHWRRAVTRIWSTHRAQSKELLVLPVSSPKSSTPHGGVEAPQASPKGQVSTKPTHDVFLCHNSNDKDQVEQIALKLKRAGIRPWFDKWEIQPGSAWQKVLEEQIEQIPSACVFVEPPVSDLGRTWRCADSSVSSHTEAAQSSRFYSKKPPRNRLCRFSLSSSTSSTSETANLTPSHCSSGASQEENLQNYPTVPSDVSNLARICGCLRSGGRHRSRHRRSLSEPGRNRPWYR
jgi:hypothetical protein